jgi:Cu(I)/Ag(I) efflux system membrane fusion protein
MKHFFNSNWQLTIGDRQTSNYRSSNKLPIAHCLLLIACCLLLILSACKQNSKEESVSKAEDVYTCPMHPQIIQTEPGNCPICGMKLVKKENANREVSEIDLSTLLKPTNTYVISQIPVTNIERSSKPMVIDALGRVDYDTRHVSTISAKVSGRIEKLYVKYRYDHIHKGHPVMDIYSPDLVTSQQELLFLLKSDPDNTTLINAARQKLLLLGLSNEQLQQVTQSGKVKQTVTVYSNHTGHIHEAISMEQNSSGTPTEMSMTSQTEELPIKEGMYVEKGQTVFQVYNTDNSWVLLNLFADQASIVKVGTPVTLVAETAPNKEFHEKISFIEPFYRSGSKTITARIYFNNTQRQIPIGSQVKARMQVMSSESYWLPRDAVLSLGLSNVVLVKEDAGFKVHAVQTGITTGNEIQILNGLTADDSVASNAQFLMDSESFIKTTDQ